MPDAPDPRREPTAAPVPDWPITVVARWADSGLDGTRVPLGLGLAAAWAWIALAPVAVGAPFDSRAVLIPLVIGAWFGGQWLRRRPSAIEVELAPERLRIQHGAGTPWIELPRRQAGTLLAAETSIDWRERLVVLAELTGRVVMRARGGMSAVQFRDPVGAGEAWWRSTMPPGTSPARPPAGLPVAPLIGAWWPDPGARQSGRGNLGFRSRWKEPDLVAYASWDRRQRRMNALIAIAALLFVYGLAVVSTWPWSVAEIVAFVPPGVVALAVPVRLLLR